MVSHFQSSVFCFALFKRRKKKEKKNPAWQQHYRVCLIYVKILNWPFTRVIYREAKNSLKFVRFFKQTFIQIEIAWNYNCLLGYVHVSPVVP